MQTNIDIFLFSVECGRLCSVWGLSPVIGYWTNDILFLTLSIILVSCYHVLVGFIIVSVEVRKIALVA